MPSEGEEKPPVSHDTDVGTNITIMKLSLSFHNPQEEQAYGSHGEDIKAVGETAEALFELLPFSQLLLHRIGYRYGVRT